MDWSSDSTSNSENSFENDWSNIYGMTTFVDNKVLMTCPFCGLVLTLPLPVEVREPSQEVDQEITSHSTHKVLQSVESPPPRTIEGRSTVVDGNEGLKEKRKGSTKESASPKRLKKADK